MTSNVVTMERREENRLLCPLYMTNDHESASDTVDRYLSYGPEYRGGSVSAAAKASESWPLVLAQHRAPIVVAGR